ncbi:MAG: TIGR02281 family clan AA aspartic protease [Alphaproteobacteria bacterium]
MTQPQPSPWDNEDPPENGGGRGGCFWTLVFLGGVVALIAVLMAAYPGAVAGDDDWMRLVYVVILLMFITLGAGAAFRGNITRSLRHIAIWVGIGAGIAILYSFRYEFGVIGDRVAANFSPAKGFEESDGKSVSFFADESGHYLVEAEVEGQMILFMVDTGASDVVLTPEDARRLRYDPADLKYTRYYNTANGTVRGAPVTLEWVGIGPVYLRNVRASVNEADMGISLLGMSFLGRLESYSVSREKLTLTQ